MGDDFAGVLREVGQQLEFRRRKMHGLVADGDGVGILIDGEVAYRYDGSGSLRSSPQMRANPRQQLLNTEWLGDVIIRAGVESFHLGAFLIANR